MMVSAKNFNDLVWVADDLSLHLKNKQREFLISPMQKGIIGNILYRLVRYIPTSSKSDLSLVFEVLSKYFQELSSEIIDLFDSPRDKLILCLIQGRHFDLVTTLISEGINGDFDKLANSDHPSQDKTISRYISQVTYAQNEILKNEPTNRIVARIAAKKQKVAQKYSKQFTSTSASLRLAKRTLSLSYAKPKKTVGQRPWLIGERRGLSAEDTGFVFFEFCRQHFPDKPIYFVTKPNTASFRKASKLGNVLAYGSFELVSKLLIAETIVYSDCGKDLYHHWHEVVPFLPTDLTGCFLQHGVIGLHNMGNFYSKHQMNLRNEVVDMFVASSKKEKSLIVDKMGFDQEQVFVTGLSRFDSLVNNNTRTREILVMPTWRLWLRKKERIDVTQSTFFSTYQKLLDNATFHQLLNKYDLTLTFCSHFALSETCRNFESSHPRIDIINTNECTLSDLVKRCAVLITDYSSVGFDFGFQGKPVLYYQFDAMKFSLSRGKPLLNLNDDLLGPVCENESDLLSELTTLCEDQLRTPTKYKKRAEQFFEHTDNQSCSRIYHSITDIVNRKRPK